VDVNGDGLADIIGFADAVYFSLSTGNGFAAPQKWTGGYSSTIWKNENIYPRRLADVNGDGLPDIVGFFTDGVHVSLATGNGFSAARKWISDFSSLNWKDENLYPRRLADVNGDGLADIVGFSHADTYVSLSTGTSFAEKQSWSKDYASQFWSNENVYPRHLVDVNGDGLTDIVGFSVLGTHVSLSTGKSFVNTGLWSNFYDSKNWINENIYPRRLADINGDGFVDVVGFASAAVITATSKITSPKFIRTVTNGHNTSLNMQYKPLTNKSVYQKEHNAQYPQQDFIAPLYVVSNLISDNGIGGRQSTTYHYEGAKVDLQGRGFRGFSKIMQTDNATGIQQISYYDRDYRYISTKLKRTETKLPNGTLLAETDNSSSLKDYGNGVHFSRVDKSVSKSYELDGSLISTSTTTNQYDDCGNPTQVSIDSHDGRVETTVSAYDNTSNCVFVTADSPWVLGRLTHTEVTRIVSGQSPQNRASRWEYDPQSGLLVKETIEPNHAQCVEKSYQYDAYGNILSSSVQGCISTQPSIPVRNQTSEYDSKGRYLLKNRNALGHEETKKYDKFGNQIALMGPNGLTTRWEYDGFGRVTKEIRADGTWTQTSYRLCEGETHCPTHAHYFVQTDTAGSPSSVVYFDRLDREIRKVAQGFDGNPIYIDSQYNARGEVVKVSDPYFATAIPVWTSNEYDVVGRVIKQTAPDETVTLKEYHGLTTIVVNPLGQRTTQVKDAQGNLIKSEDSQGKAVTYVYDGFNNPLEMRDSLGNVTQMSYDQRGNKTRLDDPDTHVTAYSYNALGELLSQTDAKNQTTTFRYDLLGRLVERQELEGTTTWGYDTATKAIGSLAKLSSSSGYREIYRYDSFGRATETLTTFNGRTFPVTRYYDQFGRTATIVYPTSFAVRHIYNNYGYLQEVQRTDSNQSVWKAERMNALGQLEKQVAGNGVVTQRTYDALTGHLQTVQTGTQNNPNNIQNLNYRFDSLGNLIERRKNSLSETFAYDSLNRLEKSSVSGGQTLTMRYDELGNITSKSDVGNYSYGNGAGPHAVTQAGTLSYSYDIVGNRISASNGQQIQYTSFNKPSRITQGSTTLEFSYSPDYDRYQQVSTQYGSTKTIWYVGSLYEQETENGLTKHKHTIFAGSDSVAVYTTGDTGEKTHWLHKDHLGSMESITDEQGNRVESLSFDAWGQRRSENWSVLTQAELETLARTVDLHRGFTGHEHLDEVNLIHMNGRVYDPVIGRFLSADPFIQFPEFTQSLNRYSYVLNNPLSLTDPSGFFSLKSVVKKVGNFFKDNWKSIIAVGVGVVVGALTAGIGAAVLGLGVLGSAVLSGAGFGFGSAFSGSLLGGGSFGDALKAGVTGAVIGGITAGLTYGIGHVFFEGLSGMAGFGAKVIAHGMVQGVSTMAQGGRFEHGFLAGMMGKVGGNFGFIGSVVAAGTASELGGGKFMNGAVSGAFVYLFNDALEKVQEFYFKKGYATLPHNKLYGVYCSDGKSCSRGGSHYGVDIAGSIGDKLPSLTQGKAIVGEGGGFGKYVIIGELMYAHLDKLYVQNKQDVNIGDIFGEMGRTGIKDRNMPTHTHIQNVSNGTGLGFHPDPTTLIFGNTSCPLPR